MSLALHSPAACLRSRNSHTKDLGTCEFSPRGGPVFVGGVRPGRGGERPQKPDPFRLKKKGRGVFFSLPMIDPKKGCEEEEEEKKNHSLPLNPPPRRGFYKVCILATHGFESGNSHFRDPPPFPPPNLQNLQNLTRGVGATLYISSFPFFFSHHTHIDSLCPLWGGGGGKPPPPNKKTF